MIMIIAINDNDYNHDHHHNGGGDDDNDDDTERRDESLYNLLIAPQIVSIVHAHGSRAHHSECFSCALCHTSWVQRDSLAITVYRVETAFSFMFLLYQLNP